MKSRSGHSDINDDFRNSNRRGSKADAIDCRQSNARIARWKEATGLTFKLGRNVSVSTVWPGPIWSDTPSGAPGLSWFSLPATGISGPGALASAINAELLRDPSAGTSSEIDLLMQRVVVSAVSRTRNPFPQCPPLLLEARRAPRVLVIDERSRSNGACLSTTKIDPELFSNMVDSAKRQHPNAEFWIAQSRDPGSGHWLSSRCRELPSDTKRIGIEHSLCSALPHIDHVYTINASEGMNGLLSGANVHVFGSPYYAGWGLTTDNLDVAGRTSRPSLRALFDVVFLRLTRYVNPATHESGTLGNLLDCIDLQRAIHQRFAHMQRVAGIRFQRWKRPFATPFLTAGGGVLRWADNVESVAPGEWVALWGARDTHRSFTPIPIVRIEDGFIHSTGLGSDMKAPYSQVIDCTGIYFDASKPNDLLAILNNAEFSDSELIRARALRESIVTLGITKYNLGRRRPAWAAPDGQRIVLVPGQVADDASIRLGTGKISSAEELLREVRTRRPDAFIVYKPHPDVLSGNRNGVVNVDHFADFVDTDSDLLSLIEIADEVHTLSSLSGFDALLRGKAVFTYGFPFYAGWGLTQDALAPIQSRQRKLSIDMLIAGILFRYSIYWDWRMQLYTTPEAVIRLIAPYAGRPLGKIRGSRMRPLIKAIRWSRNVLHHAIWKINPNARGKRSPFKPGIKNT
ncbi:capsular polysaccharide export protein, LipB/KpsS family [Burkholderia sp. FL-7-2-10-S1-D7]|uniref:capsular polysaccharide export protein, LipB/KpsS family n=1 Tax=Burkholderia sp. FL-7-2-10-S1-D7 TaxID=1637866 RepID=UPI0009EB8862|nr:capsular biosynthesis protein [Burkholderia sp. FL-7-2-10-S1-D7]